MKGCMRRMRFLPALLLAGCAANPGHKGIAEIFPLGNAPGEVWYANPQEISEGKDASDSADIPAGGNIRFAFAEYILSGAMAVPLVVGADVLVGEDRADIDCEDNSTFTPMPTGGTSLPKLHTREAGLIRTELSCDILDPVGAEFLFVVKTGPSERRFRIKTNAKPG